MRKNKPREALPETVQQTIPFDRMWKDGMTWVWKRCSIRSTVLSYRVPDPQEAETGGEAGKFNPDQRQPRQKRSDMQMPDCMGQLRCWMRESFRMKNQILY